MNTRRFYMIAAAVVLATVCLYSCKDRTYKGFEKTQYGAYLKYHEHGTDSVTPQEGDAVSFTLTQTLLNDSKQVADEENPIEIAMERHAFVGDIFDALSVMHPGDEVTLAFLADSLFLKALEQETPEEYKNTLVYYHIKLLDVIPAEQMEADYRLWIDELKKAETRYLEMAVSENKATVLKSGLLVLEHRQLKTRPVAMGEYALVDMVLCNNASDTLINDKDFFVQCGLNEICQGVDEALLTMHEGEKIKCIIPSSLAFDSTGREEMVLPYEPLHLDMKLVKVFSAAEYNRYVEEHEKKEQAEHEKRMAEQKVAIDKYLKDKGIKVEPTESGLYLKLTSFGHGNTVKLGQHVAVHYVIYNLKGEEVESSYSYGTPLEFEVGRGQMIPGIDEAVLKMNVGSKAHLVMTSDLAFDDIEIDPVTLPANSPVAIDLEIVSAE